MVLQSYLSNHDRKSGLEQLYCFPVGCWGQRHAHSLPQCSQMEPSSNGVLGETGEAIILNTHLPFFTMTHTSDQSAAMFHE